MLTKDGPPQKLTQGIEALDIDEESNPEEVTAETTCTADLRV